MIWWIAGAALLWVVGAVATYGHAYNSDWSYERERWHDAVYYSEKIEYTVGVLLRYLFIWPVIEFMLIKNNPGE